MNENALQEAGPVWPNEIAVEPDRLGAALLGESEGDIAAAYCADSFPNIKTFVHVGQLFITLSNCYALTPTGSWEASANCYPLIPENDYREPQAKADNRESKAVFWCGNRYRLGRVVRFVCLRSASLRPESLPDMQMELVL